MIDHVVHFYEAGAERLVAAVSRFLSGVLYEGDVALVAASAERMNALHAALESRGIDCRDAIKRGRLEFLDGHDVLDNLMYAGRPDSEIFDRLIGERVRDMLGRREAARLHVYGELVGILWEQGNEAGAVELERLWNQLIENLPVALYCGYPMHGFDQPVWNDAMESVLATHVRSIPERLTA